MCLQVAWKFVFEELDRMFMRFRIICLGNHVAVKSRRTCKAPLVYFRTKKNVMVLMDVKNKGLSMSRSWKSEKSGLFDFRQVKMSIYC